MMKTIWRKAIHKTIACILMVSMVCTLLPLGVFAQTPIATFRAMGASKGYLDSESLIEYSVDSGKNWTMVQRDMLVENVSVEYGIQVREYLGIGSTEEPDVQYIQITRAQTPNVTYTQPITSNGEGVIAMQAGIHQYRNTNTADIVNGSWKDATGSTFLPAGSYLVREKASGSVLASYNQEITLQYVEENPNIGIDYTNETLTGFVQGKDYTITVGKVSKAYLLMRETTMDIQSGWFGKTIGIVRKADGFGGATDSVSQSLTIPTKPSAPQAQGVPCTASDVNDGKLIDVDGTMQYRKEGDSAWIAVADTSVTGLEAGSYEVRSQASSSQFASEIKMVTVGVTASTLPNEQPNASIDYRNETLTGFVPNATYTIQNDTYSGQVTIDQTGIWAIPNECLGTTVTIVRNNDEQDSEAQVLAIPARPAEPNVKAIGILPGATMGKIMGTNTTMEYRVRGASVWTTVQGPTIDGLAISEYEVRCKATSTQFASEIKMVTVGTKRATPTVGIDYLNETVTNFKNYSTYSITVGANTTEHEMIEENALAIKAEWYGKEIAVVQKGGSSYIASEAQRLFIPAKPTAPAVTAVDCSPSGADDGKIAGVDTTMEYRLSTDTNWMAVIGTELTNLAAGTYQVRVAGNNANQTFVGETATVTIGIALPPVPTPNVTIHYTDELLVMWPSSANVDEKTATYTINGSPITIDPYGWVGIEESWFGTTIEIVRLGDATTTADSATQSLVVPAILPAPTGIKSEPCTVGKMDGKITGVDTTMVYSIDGRAWNAIEGTEITGLAAGNYFVRTKPTDIAFASANTEITVVGVYPVLVGNNQQITVAQEKDVAVTIQAAQSQFSRLNLGSKELENGHHYQYGEGATSDTMILTLKADYVKTLPVGEHTFVATFMPIQSKAMSMANRAVPMPVPGIVFGVVTLTVKPVVPTAPSTGETTTVAQMQETHINPQTGVE